MLDVHMERFTFRLKKKISNFQLNKILCQNKPFTFEKMSLNKYLNYVYLSRYIYYYIFVDFKEQQASFIQNFRIKKLFHILKNFIKIFL